MSKTAIKIKDLHNFTGSATLCRLDPALRDGDAAHELVAVSATTVLGTCETYIFPADVEGNVTNWRELEGSLKGTLSHADALAGAGYVIEECAK